MSIFDIRTKIRGRLVLARNAVSRRGSAERDVPHIQPHRLIAFVLVLIDDETEFYVTYAGVRANLAREQVFFQKSWALIFSPSNSFIYVSNVVSIARFIKSIV